MDLRLRYLARFTTAFLSRFKAIMVIGMVIGLGIFLSYRKISSLFLINRAEIVAIVGKYQPDNLPLSIQSEISQGLTKINAQNEIEPDLARKWETPDKGKTWIFYLKSNQRWQDKSNLTSGDINYNFTDAVIEKPNQQTLVFKLKDNFAPFPTVVARPVFKKGLLGTGEWRVTKLSLAGSYLTKLQLKNISGAKKIYLFYPTEDAAKTAFKLGRVDTIAEIYNPAPLNQWRGIKASPATQTNQVVAVFFNLDNPNLKDKITRQALNYAINKEAFNQQRALSPISPLSWAYNPQVKPYNFDPGKAKETIQTQAKESQIDLSLNLITSPSLLSTAEQISKDWNQAGIKTTVLVSSIIPADFEAYLAILDIPKDPDQYFLWHSTQGSNIANYNNPRIDKLLEDGRATLNLSERKNIYLDFQRFLVEDCPAIFLYHPQTYTISRR